MIQFLRNALSDTNPLRLMYHKLLAMTAAVRYGFPANKLKVIGVTGTNGKTSTVNLIAAILEEAGKKVGMTTTINFQVGDKKWSNKSKITTQGPFFMQKILSEMVKNGVEYAVLEVSSHAILQNRIWGINFDTAVITNISRDHIEYHGGLEAYINTKAKLFESLNVSKRKINTPKISVMNIDDGHYEKFNRYVADKKITYGTRGTCKALNIQYSPSGSTFTISIPNEQVEVKSNLPGDFNVYNVLAATACVVGQGINLQIVKNALAKFMGVPGRSEIVDVGQSYTVVVDYAHVPEALENICRLFKRQLPEENKIIVVFGATGGGRDKGKRPKMGATVNEYADMIVLTNDDPYTEDQWTIIQDVSKGIPRKEGENFWKILDRREAIRLALTYAKKGDVVIVAGKGAEEVIAIGTEMIPWNDKKVIKDLLSREVKIEIAPGQFKDLPNVCYEA